MGRVTKDNPASITAPECGVAGFHIDCDSGLITHCDAAAATLTGAITADLQGQPWSSVICCQPPAPSALELAIAARVTGSLSPFILQRRDGKELVVAGMFVAPAHSTSAVVLLWQLLDEDGLSFPGSLSTSDTLAVLGVDQLRYDQHWGYAQTVQLMREIRLGLLEIVRTDDMVALPAVAGIIIVLRGVDMHGALDITRALLSHLHRQSATDQAGARICVGLAKMVAAGSPLATLLAANDALLRAQNNRGEQGICASAVDDRNFLAGRVLSSHGVFSGDVAGALSGLEPRGEMPAVHPDSNPADQQSPAATIEKGIQGYVGDNMEGAVDQAIFLSRLDIPVAIIGPAGTGKMYVANIIHEEAGSAPQMLVVIDCREFRSRTAANTRIAQEFSRGEGKTLVFKSPHLMSAEAQLKLARQVSSRTLADVSPAQYLPRIKFVALFPDTLEKLIRQGSLTTQLASAFAGYPIHIPPIRDRKQAVLRWAHKILDQEGMQRARDMKGFTPDAEQAMLLYDWPGNISEMRQCIVDALEKTQKDWLTPVDLGLFKGITADGAAQSAETKPFLLALENNVEADAAYVPSALETLDLALGEAVHNLLTADSVKALGTWTDDELVLAALDRYRGDLPRAADFLHTKSRNISRWLPNIQDRDEERSASSLWQQPRRLLREWVRESPQPVHSPLQQLQDILLAHVVKQCGSLSAANRARIMGVSMPTYLKRLRDSDYYG